MEGDFAPFERAATFDFYFAFVDELLQELRMMNDFVVAAQRRVFVFEGVETMRTGRHYFFNAVHIQYLNVGHSHHLKRKLISRASGRVARTAFFCSQNGKFYAYFVQDFDKSDGYFFVAVVEGTCTADPKQNFGSFAGGGHIGHGGYFYF